MMHTNKNAPTNIVTSPPAVEPVTASEVKSSARIVDNDADDALIQTQLIPAARALVERLAGRSLITQTRKQYYDDMPCSPMVLRYSPVQSVSSVVYTDTNGVSQTLSTSLYDVDTASIPGRVVVGNGDAWPVTNGTPNSVTVTYVAGYGLNSGKVPIVYRQAIILLASHWYWNPSLCGMADGELLTSVENLIACEGRTLEYA